MKALRNSVPSGPDHRISVMVTGEYGDKRKRPHWHAILFNFRPSDGIFLRKTELGHSVYDSPFIYSLWEKGLIEFGDVSIESAGYVARYAAKKLVHGKDQDHDFHPLHRTSSKYPIGLPWIQKYWEQTFSRGFIVLPNGKTASIPRFYEDWFRKQMPNHWMEYASKIKPEALKKARASRAKEQQIFEQNLVGSSPWNYPLSRNEVKETIQLIKHEGVLKGLKL